MQGLQGFAFAGEGDIGVVIETNITDELKEEGYMREIVSKIQNTRKDKGFDVMAKITLYVSGNQTLENVVKKYEAFIKKETLAVNVIYEPYKDSVDYNINGENLKMAVEPV